MRRLVVFVVVFVVVLALSVVALAAAVPSSAADRRVASSLSSLSSSHVARRKLRQVAQTQQQQTRPKWPRKVQAKPPIPAPPKAPNPGPTIKIERIYSKDQLAKKNGNTPAPQTPTTPPTPTTTKGSEPPQKGPPSTTHRFASSRSHMALDLFPYETLVNSQPDGSNVIGGQGGTPFTYHNEGDFLKTITVWIGCGAPENGMKAIQVLLMSGISQMYGNPSSSGCNSNAFTFQPGETLSGNLIIGGNGIGTRAGYISFSTSMGNKFSAGSLHTPYTFPVDGLLISGIFGDSGSDIDSLGFFFVKKIQSMMLVNVAYPTLDAMMSGLSPKSLFSGTQCNDGSQVMTLTQDVQETTGTNDCWNVGATLTVGASVTVSAGVPEVVDVSGTASWSLSATAGYQSCTTTQQQVTTTETIQIAPNSCCSPTITQWVSTISQLPFTASLQMTFSDGSTATIATSGTYNGVYTTDVNSASNCVDMKAGTKCPSANSCPPASQLKGTTTSKPTSNPQKQPTKKQAATDKTPAKTTATDKTSAKKKTATKTTEKTPAKTTAK